MDHSKNGNISDTSSDENDQSSEKFNENTGTGRSYECTFCKRGFTNAQALGGHMNIHRKDKVKAKAKQKAQTNSLFSKRSISEDYTSSSRCFSPNSNQQTNYQVALEERMNYHQLYVPVPTNYPPYAYYHSNLTHVASLENFGLHEEHLGANLSLDIDSSNMEDGEGKNRNVRDVRMEHEVDLELRLGYDP